MRASPGAVALLVTGGAGTAVLVSSGASMGGAWWPEAVPAVFLAATFYWGGAAAVLGGRHLAAQRLLAVGALHLAAFGLSAATAVMLREQVPGAWLVNLASSVLFVSGFAAFVGLFAVFPTGRYERAYERHGARIALAVAMTVPLVHLVASPTQPLVAAVGSPPLTTDSPVHLQALEPLAVVADVVLLLPVFGVALFVLRYRRAAPETRRQMRWPLVSALLGAAGLLAHLVPTVPVLAADAVVVTALASFPVTLLVAIRRHRLLDVDFVLSRALVYAVLWTSIALAYGAGAAAAGLAAGSRVDLPTAVVVTIGAAMLFQPARHRLERLADRLVHGKRRQGYPLLRELGARLEHGAGTQDVAEAVVRAVASGLDARWVRLRLVDGNGHWSTAAASGASSTDPAVAVTLADGDGQVGVLECGPADSGSWTEDDRDLLATLARQAALAVRRARLAADLAASRARLVQAQDEERRRIERDLHDGAQQHLVALMAALEVAQLQLAGNPAQAERTLHRAQDVAREAHRTLGELARGIRPPVLGDRGLLAAVEAQLLTLPLDVEVDAEAGLRDVRFAPEVEAAAYFVVAEALTNVAKHAGAARTRVTVSADDRGLHVGVVDDGRGFDGAARVTGGLSGLRDRVEALGGDLVVDAAPGCGTALWAVIPAQVQHVR